CVLLARRRETSLKVGLGMRRIGKSRQQLSFRAIKLRLTPALARTVDLLQYFIQKIEAGARRARGGRKNRDPRREIWSKSYSAEIQEGRDSLPEHFDPASNLVRSRKQPAPVDGRDGDIERELMFARERCELLGGLVKRFGFAEHRVV